MKTFFTSLLLASLFATSALAETRVNALAAQYKLNRASVNALAQGRLGDKVVAETVHTLRASYSFAVQGGTIAAMTLLDVSTNAAAILPKGAIVKSCTIDVITQLTSGGSATISTGTGQAANDLKSALAVASWSPGLIACTPVGTVGTSIKLTADRTMTVTPAVAALTAGKFYVIVEYVLSDTL